MGNKKKHAHKWKSKHDKGKLKKIKSREDLILAMVDSDFLDYFYETDEDKRKFARYFIEQEDMSERSSSSDMMSRLQKADEKTYEKYVKKLVKKKKNSANSIVDALKLYLDVQYAEDKIKAKKKKRREKIKYDMSVASFMNSKAYKKRYLNNDEYRKSLKKIAKQEKAELEAGKKLGYIKSNDPDKELEKLYKANEFMTEALSDAYVQKHYLN